LLTATFFCFSGLLSAEQPERPRHESVMQRATINFREIAKRPIQNEKEQFEPNENEQTPLPLPLPPGANIKIETRSPTQPFLASAMSSPSPVASFLAVQQGSITSIPPDTNGAVGPNYLMVTLNGVVQIQDRSGAVISFTTEANFWSAFAPFQKAPFDPRILYDPYSQRFIFIADINAQSSTSAILVGVTQTNDPTGNWFQYEIPADTNGLLWADFPELGFNKNWIVFTADMSPVSGGTETTNIYVLPKTAVYSGNSFQYSLFAGIAKIRLAPAATYDPIGTIPTLYLIDDYGGNMSGSGYLELSTITGPVGAETFTEGIAYPSSSTPWADVVNVSNWLPQANLFNGIDQTNIPLNFNLQYRNGSLWCSHGIFLPASGPTRSAIQWWQLGTNGTVQQRGVIDDPTGTLFRARSSIAVNKFNDVLIGYSLFSSSIFASAAYSFRSSALPPNTMESEVILKGGLASYYEVGSGTRNRWGDYSYTQVDPANDSDLWTIQEFADSPSSQWGTWWGKIPAPLAMHFQVSAPATTTAGNTFSATVTALDSNNNPTADYTGTVHFTSSDGLASLPADSTLTNGAVTFTVVLRTAGYQAITATDTVNGTINGSTAISVNAGSATHVTIQTPTNAVASAAFSVTVNALDQFNNLASSYTNTAHFTSSDGAAVLPANYTFTSGASGDNGNHTFVNGVVLNTAGSQTVTVSDSSSLVATSAPITVKLASTIQLTSSLNPAYFRHATVTLTATVSATSGLPTGSVIFYDGNVTLGTVNLNTGIATLVVSSLRIGSHSITASYAGDSNFAPRNSSVLLERRSPAPRVLR